MKPLKSGKRKRTLTIKKLEEEASKKNPKISKKEIGELIKTRSKTAICIYQSELAERWTANILQPNSRLWRLSNTMAIAEDYRYDATAETQATMSWLKLAKSFQLLLINRRKSNERIYPYLNLNKNKVYSSKVSEKQLDLTMLHSMIGELERKVLANIQIFSRLCCFTFKWSNF